MSAMSLLPHPLVLVVGLAAALLLTACGGGDWEEDEHRQLQPIDCKATPEKCK